MPVALVIGQLELGGGAERQLAELALGLPDEGFSPLVISLRRGGDGDPGASYWAGRLRERGIRVEEIARAGRLDLTRLVPLIRILRRERPRIVHSFMFAANAYARTAALFLRPRPRLLISERTGLPRIGWVERIVERCLRPWTDGVVANAENLRPLLIRRGTRAPIWIVHNGIAARDYDPGARQSARRALGVGPDEPVIGTVGRLVAQKNYPLFLQVARGVRERIPGLRVFAAGDGPLRAAIEEEAGRLGLGDTMVFLGRTERVRELLPGLDVFLLTSSWEGLPNAIMEAHACGVPCVVSGAGGAGEVVADGVTGFVIKTPGPRFFVDKVVALLSDGDLRARMGREARSRIENVFTPRRMIAGTADVYRSLLRDSESAPRPGALP